MVRRFTSVIAAGDRIKRSFVRHVESRQEYYEASQFESFARKLVNEGEKRNAVLTDQVVYQEELRDSLLVLLKEHIFRNLVSVGGKIYQQGEGISQGSVLSTLLCSYFYGDLEQKALKSPGGFADTLLMRLVDDFLLITPDQSVAMNFLRKMHRGVEDYGCRVNTTKTKTNFSPRRADAGKPPLSSILQGSAAAPSAMSGTMKPSSVDESRAAYSSDSECRSDVEQSFSEILGEMAKATSGRTAVDEDAAHSRVQADSIKLWMPWCGILVNTRTLETRVDVMRYAGGYVNETITTELSANPGVSLVNKLAFFIRVKVHPLLYDPAINSAFAVGTNVYQIFHLSALKFHCHIRALPPKRRARGNPSFFAAAVLGLPDNFLRFAHLKSSQLKGGRLALSPTDIAHLSLSAFLAALQPKQTEYVTMLATLREKFAATVRSLGPARVEMWRRVATSPENDVFKEIIY